MRRLRALFSACFSEDESLLVGLTARDLRILDLEGDREITFRLPAFGLLLHGSRLVWWRQDRTALATPTGYLDSVWSTKDNPAKASSLLWQGSKEEGPPIVRHGGRIFIGTWGGELAQVDLASERVEHESRVDGHVHRLLVGGDGRLWVLVDQPSMVTTEWWVWEEPDLRCRAVRSPVPGSFLARPALSADGRCMASAELAELTLYDSRSGATMESRPIERPGSILWLGNEIIAVRHQANVGFYNRELEEVARVEGTEFEGIAFAPKKRLVVLESATGARMFALDAIL